MKLKTPYCFLAALLLGGFCFPVTSKSQSGTDPLHKARELYKKNDYSVAVSLYAEAWKRIENKPDLLWEAGQCAWQANQLEFSIQCLERYLQQSGKNENEVSFLLAQAFQHQYKFEDAIRNYKASWKSDPKRNPKESFIKNELLRCNEGRKLRKKDSPALVESLGAAINSPEDEYAPVPDALFPGNFYFSAVRPDNMGGKRDAAGNPDSKSSWIHADIFQSSLQNGTWSIPSRMKSDGNGPMEDRILDLADSGRLRWIYQNWNPESGRIIVDSLNRKDPLSAPAANASPLIESIGDHAAFLFQDSVLVFSSRRAGGYGGYDLYLSALRNGVWSPAVNLGPEINGPFNEDFPALANDGYTLYFSSDNLKSIGGFDLFKSRYRPEAQSWEIPENLGIPVNSAGDDIQMRLLSDGLTGIFSSNRKSNNLGGFDLYWCYFKEELEEQMFPAAGTPLSGLLDPLPDDQSKSWRSAQSSFKPMSPEKEIPAYTVDWIYYKDDQFVKDSRNKKILENLIRILHAHPEVMIEIDGHAYEEAAEPVNLYFSMKQAEALEGYLREKGIASDRIRVFGLGSSIPLAKPSINGIATPASGKFNKRIEYSFLHPDSSRIRFHYSHPAIEERMRSGEIQDFAKRRTKLSYSVFLGATSGVLNHPAIRRSEGLRFIQKIPKNESYSYYLGVFNSFTEAEQAANLIREKDGQTASIRAFWYGKELDRNEIIDHVSEYPDLVLYLNYLNQTTKNRDD